LANRVHSTAIVHESVVMGDGNIIGPYCIVGPGTVLGDENSLLSHVVVGSPAEKHGFFDGTGSRGVKIGSSNTFREFSTVHAGTLLPTAIGDRCFLLRGCHVGHDSVVEDDVTVSCSAMIGGESHVMRGANLGLGCVLHQRTVVGSYSMIGMNAAVPKGKAVMPGCVFVGVPARYLKPNDVGLRRFKVDEPGLAAETKRWEALCSRA